MHLALSLVEYEPELQKAMEYVFGTTLVCDNMDIAKKVTFDKRIMTKSVTLDGDVFDPQGTLRGGNCWFYSYNNTVCLLICLLVCMFFIKMTSNIFI